LQSNDIAPRESITSAPCEVDGSCMLSLNGAQLVELGVLVGELGARFGEVFGEACDCRAVISHGQSGPT